MSAHTSAKFLTSLIAAAAMVASLSVAAPAQALTQDQRNIVGGIAIGVLGSMAIHSAKKKKAQSQQTYVCQNPYRTMRNGQVVWACR